MSLTTVLLTPISDLAALIHASRRERNSFLDVLIARAEGVGGAQDLPLEEAGPDRSPAPDDLRNPTVNFRSERRSNATHESTTDPDARLFRKGTGREAKLCYMCMC
jgi:hypothetical protein